MNLELQNGSFSFSDCEKRMHLLLEVKEDLVAIRLKGEADYSTAEEIMQLIRKLSEITSSSQLTIDCRELTFCDAAFIDALKNTTASFSKSGITLELLPGTALSKLLSIADG